MPNYYFYYYSLFYFCKVFTVKYVYQNHCIQNTFLTSYTFVNIPEQKRSIMCFSATLERRTSDRMCSSGLRQETWVGVIGFSICGNE